MVRESPGRGDFAPFEVEPGELVLFWGNQLEHHTLPNKTDSTRVSFDVRVLLADFYDGDLAAHSQAINGQRFEPGKYYGCAQHYAVRLIHAVRTQSTTLRVSSLFT